MRVGPVVSLVAVVVGLVALDRLLRWMERRGWIFYRERGPSGSGAGNALAELQAMLTPAARELVVAKAEPEAEEDDDGGPPGTGVRGRTRGRGGRSPAGE